MSMPWHEIRTRAVTQAISSSSTSASVYAEDSNTVVFEVTASTSLIVSAQAVFTPGGTARNVPCVKCVSGTYSAVNAGTIMALGAGDLVFVPVTGEYSVQLTRTSGSGEVTSIAHPANMDALSLITGGVTASISGLVEVASGDRTDVIYNGTTALTPKFATVAVSSSGVNQVVAAVTSKKIRLIAAYLSCSAAVNAKWQGDTSGTPVDLSGLMYGTTNSGIVMPYNPVGWLESAAGKNLGINLSGAIAVGGTVVYVEV